MKFLTWDGTGTIVIHKKLDAGRFDLPRATTPGEQHLQVSAAIFDVIHRGVALTPRAVPRRYHGRAVRTCAARSASCRGDVWAPRTTEGRR